MKDIDLKSKLAPLVMTHGLYSVLTCLAEIVRQGVPKGYGKLAEDVARSLERVRDET